MGGRRTHRAQVVAAIGTVLREHSADEWVRRLAPRGLVVAAVGSLKDALEGDIARDRGLVVTLGNGELALRAVASPLRFSGYAPRYGLPPLLNEHAEAVLRKDLA